MGSAASHGPSADLAGAVNAFGNDLFDRLAAEAPPGAHVGLFLSPFSVAQALAMVLNGVEPEGQSFRQLQATVYGGGKDGGPGLADLNAQMRQLSAALVQPPTEDITVADANSAWLHSRYSLQPGFAEALQAAFGVDAARPLTTAAAINGWVSDATRGKIKDIVDEGTVAQAVLVLVNALYFKGLWQHQFKKVSTHPHTFEPAVGSPLQAAMMVQCFKDKSAVKVAPRLPAATASGAALECAAVELPYRGGEFHAVAAVPLGEWSSEAAEGGQRALSTGSGPAVPYSEALAACRRALLTNLPGSASAAGGEPGGGLWQVKPAVDVHIFLPRFEVEFSATLNKALQQLGVTKPFEGGDITRVATDAEGQAVGDLQVSAVLHKVYAKVDEAGTEAAASTAVIMMRSAMVRPREQLTIKFDRPFVFAVVHAPTRLVLFCGEVHRPEEWKAEG